MGLRTEIKASRFEEIRNFIQNRLKTTRHTYSNSMSKSMVDCHLFTIMIGGKVEFMAPPQLQLRQSTCVESPCTGRQSKTKNFIQSCIGKSFSPKQNLLFKIKSLELQFYHLSIEEVGMPAQIHVVFAQTIQEETYRLAR